MADLAYFFSTAVRRAVLPYLPEEEKLVARRLRCRNRYEYRLALGATFTCLLDCFPTGDRSLERDRGARGQVARRECCEQVAEVSALLGGVRIPGSYLSFAEWVGKAEPRWDLLEAVHRQEAEGVPLEEPDEALAQGLLREVRDLMQSIRCRRCGGDGIIMARAGRIAVATTPWEAKDTSRVRSWRTCCPICRALGYGMTDALYQRYKRLTKELEEGRARIRPEVYEKVWLSAREFLLKAFLYSRVAKEQRSDEGPGPVQPVQPAGTLSFVGDRRRVTNLQETTISLVHSLAFRAQGPEADELAQLRFEQFSAGSSVRSICRGLGPATIPGTSLTLEEWSRPRSRREKARQAAQPTETSPEPEGDMPAVSQ